MNKIFISYRRQDSIHITGRIYDHLAARFGKDMVFKDSDSIPLGVNFKTFLEQVLPTCAIQIVVIGPDWLKCHDDSGRRRLDSRNDFVRMEIEAALRLRIPIIPVLVMGAQIPTYAQLPSSLADLSFYNGMPLRPDPDFKNDIDRLGYFIELWCAKKMNPSSLLDQPTPVLSLEDIDLLTRSENREANHVPARVLPQIMPRMDKCGALPVPALSVREDDTRLSVDCVFVPDLVTYLERPKATQASREEVETQPERPLNHAARIKVDTGIHMEWAEVPCGVVGFRKTDTNTQENRYFVDTFHISRYLVSNADYQKFIEATDGYRNPAWWNFSPQAKEWRAAHPTAKPSMFTQPNQPKDSISWFDAMAYCRWLSRNLNLIIQLPTEQQWQRAAQGDDHRLYPWGNSYEFNRSNTFETQLKVTTPVNYYPRGCSPYRVYDMHGNVQQWCLNSYSAEETSLEGSQDRVIRGSAWCTKAQPATWRGSIAPTNQLNYIGFRVVALNR